MLEAYKVGVTIALTNKVSQGLMLIGRDLTKTNAQAAKLNATLKEIKLLGVGGAILGGVGYAGLHALGKTLDAAQEYQQALGQFKALNLGDAVNKDADKFARGSQIIGASATDLMDTVKEMHTVLNNYGESKMIAPMIAQMQFANKAIGGEKGAAAFNEGQRQMLGKVLEYRGGYASKEEMWKQGDYMQHVMSGTGFMVMPRDYRNMLARGGLATQQMSNDAFYYKSEPLVQMMSGNAVGVGLGTAYGRMIFGNGAGGPGGKAYLELLDRLGLVKAGSLEHNAHTGKITKVRANFLKDSEIYKSDPYEFLEGVLVPAMRAAGMDERAIESGIAQIYGKTGGAVFNQYHAQYRVGKAQGKVATDRTAMGTDDLVKLARSSPQGAKMALGAAWKNLKIASGEALIPIVIPALNRLADSFRKLGKWINQHPIKFEYLIEGLGGLSLALMGGGAVLGLAGALRGLGLIIGVGAGGGAIAAVLAFTGVIAGLAAVIGKENLAKVGEATDWLGGKYNPLSMIQNGTHWAADNFRWDGSSTASSVVPPAKSGQGSQTVVMQVDGRTLGQITIGAIGDAAHGPPSSGGGFDGRMSPMYSGLTVNGY